MSSTPVPDPYAALGVAKDADQTQIKSVYRKLALKFHPDKVTDESKKAEASDNFHKIQQAYEILGDEEKRLKYDAQARLAALRAEVLSRQQQHNPHAHVHTHAQPPPPPPLRTDFRPSYYDMPPPSPVRPATFSPRAERYERPRSYDDYPEPPLSARSATRKPSYNEKEYKRSPKLGSEQKAKSKASEKSGHHERRRTTDKDRRRDRESKKDSRDRPYVHDDSDDSDIDMSRPRSRPSEAPRERDRDRTRDRERDRTRDSYDHPRRRTSDESDSEDEFTRKMRSASMNAKEYHLRSSHKGKLDDRERRPQVFKNPTLDNVKDWDGPRRSSVSSNGRDRHHTDRVERQRQFSAPTLETTSGTFARPTPERSSTTPIEVSFDPEKKSKAPKSFFYEVSDHRSGATLRREHTEPLHSRRHRPGMPRESSKLHYEIDPDYGLPSPAASPPREYSRFKSRHSDEDNYERDASPRDSSRRRRGGDSPPPPLERRTRSSYNSSSRQTTASTAPTTPRLYGSVSGSVPTLSKLQIPKSEPIWASQLTDEPQSSRTGSPRPSPTRNNTKNGLLYGEMPPPPDKSSSKGGEPKSAKLPSRSRDWDESTTPYHVKEFAPKAASGSSKYEPVEMRTGSSRRNSARPAAPSRGSSFTVAS